MKDYLLNLWNHEPARVIGFTATVVVLVGQQLLAQDIVTSAGAVKWVNLVVALVPAVVAELTRSQVTPA